MNEALEEVSRVQTDAPVVPDALSGECALPDTKGDCLLEDVASVVDHVLLMDTTDFATASDDDSASNACHASGVACGATQTLSAVARGTWLLRDISEHTFSC